MPPRRAGAGVVVTRAAEPPTVVFGVDVTPASAAAAGVLVAGGNVDGFVAGIAGLAAAGLAAAGLAAGDLAAGGLAAAGGGLAAAGLAAAGLTAGSDEDAIAPDALDAGDSVFEASRDDGVGAASAIQSRPTATRKRRRRRRTRSCK